MSEIKNVVIFCGASATPKYMDLAYEVGKTLAENGFVTITGGGPGMMEQVNKGAFDAGGESHGICIEKKEEVVCEYFTYKEFHKTFDVRHKSLLSLGQAFVALPGGLGTVLEAIEITQRKKFGELPMSTPLIFVGEYFDNLTKAFSEFAEKGFIKEPLSELYQFAPTPSEMIAILKNA